MKERLAMLGNDVVRAPFARALPMCNVGVQIPDGAPFARGFADV
jgi:hypothetical protein